MVCEAISKWDVGSHGRKMFLSNLKLKCSTNVTMGLRKENQLRLIHAKKKITEKYRRERQLLRGLRKRKRRPDFPPVWCLILISLY